MSLRTKLLLIIVTIVGLIAVGEGLLLQSLTRELEHDLVEAATTLSQSLITEIRVINLAADAETPDPTELMDSLIEATESPLEPEAGPGSGGDSLGEETTVRRRIGVVHGTPDPARLVDSLDRLGVELSEDQRSLVLGGPAHHARVDIPIEGTQATLRRYGRRLLLGSSGVALLGVLLGTFLAHRVTSPLKQLAAAAEEVGAGQLGVQVRSSAGGEVGTAIEAFNSMSRRLGELEAETRSLRSNQYLSELGEVGRGLAHSLRNPLNTLGLAVGEIEALTAQGPSDATRTAHLATDARRQIHRIDRALRSFLALSTGPVGQTGVASVDLADLARDVALEAMQTAGSVVDGGEEGKAVRIDVEAPGEVSVRGVEAELRAALHALVINAVEASPPGSEVAITVRRSDGGATITVHDHGPGLASEIRGRLFTPHVTTKPRGAGIGLYLAHSIATNRYRGSLSLDDSASDGTRATLRVRDRREAPA